MKHQRKTVRVEDYRLDWLRDADYSGLEKLSDLGWCFQIEARRDLLVHLEVQKQYPGPLPIPVLRKIGCVRDTPVVTLTSIKNASIQLHDFWHLSCFLTQKSSEKFVTKVDSMSWKRHQLCENIQLLELDLSAPDVVIKSEFEIVLSRLRDAHPGPADYGSCLEPVWKPTRQKSNSNRPWPLEADEILSGKLIQFVDLIIWQVQKGIKKIPDSVKETLLFQGFDPEESDCTRDISFKKKANNHISTISR